MGGMRECYPGQCGAGAQQKGFLTLARYRHVALTSRASVSPSIKVTPWVLFLCVLAHAMLGPRVSWRSGPVSSPAVQTIAGPWTAEARGGSNKAWC